MNDTNLTLNISSRFRKNLLEIIEKLIMTIYDKIRDEKLQENINRETVKISAFSSGKFDKYGDGEEISPLHQSIKIEQAKSTYSPSEKTLEKQIKKYQMYIYIYILYIYYIYINHF